MNKILTLFILLFVCFFSFSCKKSSNSAGGTVNNIVIEGEFIPNFGYESICKTTQNNIAIVAQKSYPGFLYVAMMNQNLCLLWQKTFSDQINQAGGITGTSDGGVIIACNQLVSDSIEAANYCLDIRKLNSNGGLQWEKKYSFFSFGANDGPTYPIRETSDKGFIIGVLDTLSDKRLYPALFRINAQGDSLWSKTVHGFCNCIVIDVRVAPDGGFLVSGPCLVYKTDSLGNYQWFNDATQATTLQVFQDGSFVAIGESDLVHQYLQLCKVDANGNKIWEQTYTMDQAMYVGNVCMSNDSGYMFTYGKSSNSVWMVKTDAQGNKLSETSLNDYGTWGIVQIQNKYYCYNYDYNTSTHYYNLVVKIVE
jgi:hypothetical protein